MKKLMLVILSMMSLASWACYYDFTEYQQVCAAAGETFQICGPGDGWGRLVIGCREEPDACIPSHNGCCFKGNLSYEVYHSKVCPAGPNGSAPSISTSPGPFPNPEQSCGSIIVKDTQVLQERIALAGVPFPIVYSSEKVKGRKAWHETHIPITGSTFTSDPSIVTMDLEVKIAGQTISQSFTPAASLSYHFTWDGKDISSNIVFGPYVADIKVDRTYTTQPAYPAPTQSQIILGSVFDQVFGFGGWDFSIHHHYDNVRKVLYLGDGTSQQTEAALQTNGDHWVLSSDGSEVFVFNSAWKHVKTKHALTGSSKWTFSYNGSGRLQSVTDAYSMQTSLQYTGDSLSSITSPHGQVTAFTTDSNGYLATVTDPESETYAMTYTSLGLLTTFENPSGTLSTMTYDSSGLLLTDSSSAGSSSTLSRIYEDEGFTISEVTELGRASTHKIVSNGKAYSRVDTYPTGFAKTDLKQENGVIDHQQSGFSMNASEATHPRFGVPFKIFSTSSVYSALMGSVSRAYSEVPVLTNPSDPFSLTSLTATNTLNGNSTVSVYDAATKTFTETTPEGRVSKRTINSQGDVTSTKLAYFVPVEVTYDGEGKVTEVAQGLSRKTSFAYHPSNGLLTSVTNPLMYSTSFTHDLNGRVVTQTLPDSRVISYSYDANGNIASMTPPGRPSHTLTYNGFDLLSDYLPPTITPPGTLNTTYAYNDDRQITNITRPDAQSIDFNYHEATGNLTSMTLPTGTRSFGYDTNGMVNMSQSEDSILTFPGHSGTQHYQDNLRASPLDYTVGNYFDPRGWKTQEFLNITDTNGPIDFTYDNDGLMLTAGNEQIIRHDSTGFVTDIDLGKVREFYDVSTTYGELSTMQAWFDGSDMTYEEVMQRDHLSRITQLRERYGSPAAKTYNYTYDSAGRLTEVKTNGVTTSLYSFDSNSNRTSQTISGLTTTATYDNQDRLLTFGTKSFTYNRNGELESMTDSSNSQTTSYTYDVLGNLKSVALPTKTVSYAVDARSRRIVKMDGTTVENFYVWNVENQIVGVADANGALVARFVYGSRVHVPDFMIKNGVEYKIVSNHLGSPVQVIDVSTGVIAQDIKYNEFGKILNDTAPGFTPFGFAGCLYDVDTRLCRFGARDYDASIGRWLSKDPILFNGGDTNLYGYVLQDPVNYIDINGKNPIILIGIGVVGVGLAANWIATDLAMDDSKIRSTGQKIEEWWNEHKPFKQSNPQSQPQGSERNPSGNFNPVPEPIPGPLLGGKKQGGSCG